MARSSDVTEILGHSFARPELLLKALTHSSFVNELEGESPATAVAPQHNEQEQMEFLGDAVLGFVVCAKLVEHFPEASEGSLSKIKAQLVSSKHLFEVATRIGLGQFMRLGRGEENNGGRTKRALLVNTMEALIAALYLDGGIPAAEGFVTRHIIGDLDADIEAIHLDDYKSALQELAQSRQLKQPRYRVIEERGPEHRKVFVSEVRIGEESIATAEGATKKSAEQAAARAALKILSAE
jgi:ribonuclease-3